MRKLGLFIGTRASDRVVSQEDPSSSLRLAALTASWAVSEKHTLLVLGDAPAMLAVGTAVLGLHQGRVLEGGERQASPVNALSLIQSENPDLDRSLGFWRRSREEIFPDFRDSRREKDPENEGIFGDLSLLMDLGIMDLVGQSQRSLEAQEPELVAEVLANQLLEEQPQAIIAFSQLPKPIAQVTNVYARERRVPLACVLGELEGSHRLYAETTAPVLNGRRIRFQEQRDFEEHRESERVQETADEELMQVAYDATWEAEMAFQIYKWLEELSVYISGHGR